MYDLLSLSKWAIIVWYAYMADLILDSARGVGGRAAESRIYLQVYLQQNGSRFNISMNYCQLCLKFRCHGKQGQLSQNLTLVIR